MPTNSPQITSLIEGYRSFRTSTYRPQAERYRKLAERQQKPKAMIICCCDSRADPAMVLNTDPGELFVVRNVANLVPPYEPDSHYHGTSAALEFGVTGLDIADLIVMGHERCGGIEALYEGTQGHPHKGEFISNWMSIAEGVAQHVCDHHPELDRNGKLRMMEQQAVLRSMDMLATFPFISDRIADGRLRLHGWFYGIGTGLLSIYNENTGAFETVQDDA
ncbi:MAG: carbonic anhydrase [Rhizobiales bacterium]|nr:carbonic anhydrase [Hyphomicrobiales bacterium]